MKFSVITINYNNVEGLRKTIASVVGQTCNDYEYIVIDGGSTDGSVDVIKEYSHKINYWVSESDAGIYNAMNKGVAEAHGEYCIFMNSGDCFYAQTVLESVNATNHTEDIVVGKVVVDRQDHIISPPPKDELTMYHLYSGSIPHQGSFIRTKLLRKYPYDESLKISSDWKFFVQTLILDNCTICYLDEFVARYDTDGLSSSNPKLMRQEKEAVMSALFPPRVLADYRKVKESECLTQTLTPQLRKRYGIDKLLFRLGSFLLKLQMK
jgi:glycosyltransferase involved in cell wall biosynthesis